jgi:predicted acylesterase/phospholipase RssA
MKAEGMGAAGNNQPSKTALVLAGGGLTGAVYEIGALRAIDDMLVGRTVNDFDIYVGTSAGALVTSLLANGLSPEEMLRSIANDHPHIPPVSRDELFHFNYADLLRLGLKIPQTVVSAWTHYLRHLDDMTIFDLLWSLSEALPSGAFDNLALERYLRRVLTGGGRTNDFRKLKRDLHIIATDLDSGRREVFGHDSHANVPISLAVAASTALPVLYKPVRIGGRDYLDGGLRGNASLDLAIEHGATLVLCINPLVPYDNSDLSSIPFLGADGGHLSAKGFTAIASQVGRISTHAGLHYHVKQLRRSHPEVDIILIEPDRDDYAMFFYNIMRYSAQMIVARHGFESVTLRLAEDYPRYKELLARHGISITRRLVIEELEEIRRAGNRPAVIRKVLEDRAADRDTFRRQRPMSRLRDTLADLDAALDQT